MKYQSLISGVNKKKKISNCYLLKFLPSMLSDNIYYHYISKVTGVVTNAQEKAKWVITGTWDTHIESAQVLHVDESSKRPVFATGPKKVIWKRRLPP